MNSIRPDFFPDPQRAREMDASMCRELVASLRSICAQVETQSEALTAALAPVQALAARLEQTGPSYPPALFTAYYQLVLALVENLEQVDDKVAQLVTLGSDCQRPSMRFKDFSDPGLGGAAQVSLYRFAFDTDSTTSFRFWPPSLEDSQETQASILRGLDLMARTSPTLRAEFDMLVHEIILAAPSVGAREWRFDGASSYMLWGALALSVDERQSDLQRMETLAHECAHSLLFGFSIDEPLVLNDDSDRYSSPLRQDPRPMDGIYHATYVSARMHYAMSSALNSGLLDAAQQAEAQARMATSEQAFFSGFSVVEAHADLSPTGQAVMEAAVAYMRGAASAHLSNASEASSNTSKKISQ